MNSKTTHERQFLEISICALTDLKQLFRKDEYVILIIRYLEGSGEYFVTNYGDIYCMDGRYEFRKRHESAKKMSDIMITRMIFFRGRVQFYMDLCELIQFIECLYAEDSQITELKKMCNEFKTRCDELELALKYAPHSVAYDEAKEHFEEYSKKHKV